MDTYSNKRKSSGRINTRTLVGLGLLTAIVIVLQFLGASIRFGTFSVSLVLMPIVVGAALFGVGAGAWLGLVFGIVVLLSGDANTFMAINQFGTIVTVIVKGVLAGALSGLVFTSLAKLFSKNNATERWATIIACLVLALGGAALLALGIKLNGSAQAVVEAADAAQETAAHPGTFCIVFGSVLAAIGLALLVYVLVKKPDLDITAAVFAAAAICPIVNTGIFLLGCKLFFFNTIKKWAGGTNVGTFMIVGLVGLNFLFELAVNLILTPAIVMLIRYGESRFSRKR